jgi:hypothetical protein
MQKDYEKIMKLKELYETYTIQELEKIAVRASDYKIRDEEELEAALSVRRWKLNSTFEWTPENKEKLLKLDAKLIECFEKLKAEASNLYENLKQRVENNDGFLQDYMIHAKVIPSVRVDYDYGTEFESEIYEVFCNEWDNFTNLAFSIYQESPAEAEILYLDRKQNWNTDHWFKVLFDKDFISQSIHDLYDHTKWSFQDILKINHLDLILNVEHNHFVELKN